MGSSIGLASNSGGGSRFWFTLPTRVPQAPDGYPSKALEGPEPTLAGHVLVADDNAINRLVAAELLQSLGLTSCAVSDGNEAVRRLNEQHFDLVLMDCQMPELDGFAATRIIRAGERATGTHVPILALTANAMADARVACMEGGMDDYLSKPLKKERLAHALRRWLA